MIKSYNFTRGYRNIGKMNDWILAQSLFRILVVAIIFQPTVGDCMFQNKPCFNDFQERLKDILRNYDCIFKKVVHTHVIEKKNVVLYLCLFYFLKTFLMVMLNSNFEFLAELNMNVIELKNYYKFLD